MHAAAVYALAAVTLWYVWQSARELLVAWYSGSDPPLSRAQVIWICAQMLLGVVATIVAVVTLGS